MPISITILSPADATTSEVVAEKALFTGVVVLTATSVASLVRAKTVPLTVDASLANTLTVIAIF